MPLTTVGEEVLAKMKKTYGPERGESVFYASINDDKPGSDQWHHKPRMGRKMKRHAEIMGKGPGE